MLGTMCLTYGSETTVDSAKTTKRSPPRAKPSSTSPVVTSSLNALPVLTAHPGENVEPIPKYPLAGAKLDPTVGGSYARLSLELKKAYNELGVPISFFGKYL